MEWYANEWCVTLEELTRDDRTEADQSEYLSPIIGLSHYKQLAHRGKLRLLRQGKGKGNYALISFASLPEVMQAKLRAKYPDIVEMQKRASNPAYELFRRAYERDYDALSYYHRTLRALNKSLSKERISELAEEYTTNASVIQAVIRVRRDNELYRKVRGKRVVSWAEMSDVIKFYQAEYGHTLGVSPTRFASWVRSFEKEGYAALISKKFGNMNTLKVSVDVERLLLEMASDRTRPYKRSVWEWYCEFLRGDVEYINMTTGELYDPKQFPDLSEKLVGDILRKRLNQARLSKTHDARHDYMTGLRPHHKRQKPKYSLSMVSLDDKDFAVKIKWCIIKEKVVRGEKKLVKKWVETALKAYLCYDVASSAIIGWAFSGEKNSDLFERCVQSMYRNLLSWGLGQPYEAQVENHIVSGYKEGMMRSGCLFPKVTFAGAENSQEKYAEHFNRQFKYQVEKDYAPEVVGRPFARLAENRTKNRKVSDGQNNNYEQREYNYAEAVEAYEQMIRIYNNMPHPEQKLYPGKTRLEVLLEYQHNEIKAIDEVQVAYWAGRQVETSVKRGQFRAIYEDYALNPEQEERLRGTKGKVTAYYLPYEGLGLWNKQVEPIIETMHLYQEAVYLGACPRIVPYQVSTLERSDDDERLIAEQAKRLRAFDKAVEDKAPEGLIRFGRQDLEAIHLAPIRTIAAPHDEDVELDGEEDCRTNRESIAHRAVAEL